MYFQCPEGAIITRLGSPLGAARGERKKNFSMQVDPDILSDWNFFSYFFY